MAIRRGFCPECGSEQIGEVQPASHLLHLCLTLVTAGLWLPVWIAISLAATVNCRECGTRIFQNRFTAALSRATSFGIWGIAALLAGVVLWAILATLIYGP